MGEGMRLFQPSTDWENLAYRKGVKAERERVIGILWDMLVAEVGEEMDLPEKERCAALHEAINRIEGGDGDSE